MAQEDRTEKATPRRREEARGKGNVPRSLELSSAFVLLCTVIFLKLYASAVYSQMVKFLAESYSSVSLAPGDAWLVFRELAILLLIIVGPVLVVAALAAVLANFLQVGFLFTSFPLQPNLNRLNPIANLGRIFSWRGTVEVMKSILKLTLIAWVVYGALVGNLPHILGTIAMPQTSTLSLVGDLVWTVLIRSAVAIFVLSLADYGFQRWQYEKSIAMTREEVIRELRETEGDPMLRARRRGIMRQLAMRRMMQEVPKSDVIITNPVEYAVALRYVREEMAAPRVVAKGRRNLAERIREEAVKHDVPIIEDAPLARRLHSDCDVGDEIPLALYAAVAEVLSYVYNLKKRPA